MTRVERKSIEGNEFQRDLLRKIAQGKKLMENLEVHQKRGTCRSFFLDGLPLNIEYRTVENLTKQRLLTYRYEDYPERVYRLTDKGRRIARRIGGPI